MTNKNHKTIDEEFREYLKQNNKTTLEDYLKELEVKMRRDVESGKIILPKERIQEMERVAELRKSPNGKYKVLGIDKFDGGDWIHGHYDTAEDALDEARRMTREAMKDASDASIATVYYAYGPQGNYLGGDVWHGE